MMPRKTQGTVSRLTVLFLLAICVNAQGRFIGGLCGWANLPGGATICESGTAPAQPSHQAMSFNVYSPAPMRFITSASV
ncbi:MAG: hypothetical protein WDM80_12730 [Limisphaerales bacterium]